MTIRRIPEVKTLHDILPDGSAGGKEFARVVDLLLFHDGRRQGKKVTIFSDAAGDYRGLDSFEGDSYRKEGTIGYQYKFYPSPLSASHRSSILETLKKVIASYKNEKLKKWILVTPEDLTESSTRKDNGDVTWFENLRAELNVDFEVEHWGHKKLIALLIETPSLCLRYYPELIPEGIQHKRSIQDTRLRYDENIQSLYKNIEFVGMSIYKPEATKGVPMENIYIPLSVVPEASIDADSNIRRINPLSFLVPGARSVILGDPGSGKSTLLRFLALCGLSESLQKRYKTKSDDRLPIVITLRRYADELKSRRNLSLIDYLQENIHADFSLNSADIEFFEYYLETGQAILLFDGIDELPDSNFKQLVRNRIKSFATTYPGNTIIVTSRIVGYENPFRFDERDFRHYRITKLQLPEIERFVHDWYQFRIENENERNANIKDLIRIMRDESSTSIKELAENPLLLTIVTLVHRIDAVLPDERVVLYQKCTETLLNTWHTWKYRDIEVKNRGRVERRNRRRMEAIAHWMQGRSLGTGKSQRFVAPYVDLLNFLTQYIVDVEKAADPDNDPEDLASDFLEFVRQKAGLLIEVGDQTFSFVHLTFQEYLTSSYLITTSEKDGLASIWNKLRARCADTKWYEVIRLLVAGLKSEDSQEFMIEKLLSEKSSENDIISPLLLGGLLIDGVGSAEVHKEEIIYHLVISGIMANNTEDLRSIISLLRNLTVRDQTYEHVISKVFTDAWNKHTDPEYEIRMVLFAISTNFSNRIMSKIIGSATKRRGKKYEALRLFFSGKSSTKISGELRDKLDLLWSIQDLYSITSPYLNFLSSSLQAIATLVSGEILAKRSFEQILVTLYEGMNYGPFSHLTYNSFQIAAQGAYGSSIKEVLPFVLGPRPPQERALQEVRDSVENAEDRLVRPRNTLVDLALNKVLGSRSETLSTETQLNSRRSSRASARRRAMSKIQIFANRSEIAPDFLKKIESWQQGDDRKSPLRIDRDLMDIRSSSDSVWDNFIASPDLYNEMLNLICDCLQLEPRYFWWEALRVSFLPKVPDLMHMFDHDMWLKVIENFRNETYNQEDIYVASWLILINSWLTNYYKDKHLAIFDEIITLTHSIDNAPIQLAHCIRDISQGDQDKTSILAQMIKSEESNFDTMFRACLWKPYSKRDK